MWLQTSRERLLVIGLVLSWFLTIFMLIIFLQQQPVSENIEVGAQRSEVDHKEDRQAKADKITFLMIDIKGEINKPGVYKLNQGARILDVIQMAGGLTKTADAMKINQAQQLTDGQIVCIPHLDSSKNNCLPQKITAPNNDKIAINTATVSDLQALPGIGKAKSEAIIKSREEKGPFRSVADLERVKGISKEFAKKLAEKILF